MPQKHNDIKHWVDPEQIRRYLAGELDDKAMHLLEKRALEDPFLAEALEGFAEHTPDQNVHLADLESRLEQRVAEKKVRKLPVYFRWAAAAVILLLAGIGVTKMWELPEKKGVAKVAVPHDSVAPAAIINEKGEVVDRKPDFAVSDIQKPLPAPVVSVPHAKEEATLQRDDSPAANSGVSLDEVAPSLAKAKQEEMVEKDTVTENDALAAVSMPAPEKDKKVSLSPTMIRGRVAGVAVGNAAPAKKRILKGKITDKNNSPLPAVSVLVNNTNNGTLTDKEGNFAIQVDSTSDVQLNVNYIGYESKRLQVDNKQNNLNIAIDENNKALNEVVVTGYGTTKRNKRVAKPDTVDWMMKQEKVAYQAPVPGEGFESYQKYLVEHVRYPVSAGGIKGTVKVAFTVKSDGRLKDFKVINKLQSDCDKEAIRVIKEGPAWIPASDGRSGRVHVDVPFAP